ncbi:iron-sulfur cluster assembly 2-like protein [Haematococcus lacustris]
MLLTAARLILASRLSSLSLLTLPNFQTPTFATLGVSSGTAGSIQGDGLLLDDSAVQRLRKLQQEKGHPILLRIEVEGGGCSGFQYKFSLDSQPQSTDVVFGPEGAQVVCDSVSLDLLRGARIEWEESLMRSAFVVGSNPNSEASCGCGSSFTAKAITPPSRQRAGKAS